MTGGGALYTRVASIKNDWDGTHNGTVLPTGSYTYVITYEYINPLATQPNSEGSTRTLRGVVNILP